EQLAEAETRPNFRTLHESPVEIVVATNHGRGYLRLPIVIPESADAEDLVDDEPRRDVAAGGHEDAAASIEHGAAGAEKRLQVDDRQQLAADVGDAAQPELRARHAGDRIRHRQYLAHVAASGDEVLVADPKADAGPFVGGRGAAVTRGGRCPREALELEQQLERTFPQACEAQAPDPSIVRSRTSFAFATST